MKRQHTILIIEDEIYLRELMEDELSSMGFRVICAGDGQDGLDKIHDDQPDLIICDRMMPSMTGSELLTMMRGIFPQYSDIPFIFLTALSSQNDRDQVAELKPYAYLYKPLDFDVLFSTIESALGS
jgi:DNA-binding response OmpR family regulator